MTTANPALLAQSDGAPPHHAHYAWRGPRRWRYQLKRAPGLDRPFEVVAHRRAFGEDASEHEREDHGQPTVDREAGIEVDRMRRRRHRLADRADDDAEQL